MPQEDGPAAAQRAAADIEGLHEEVVDELASSPGRVFVVGGVDSGKTSFSLRLARAALAHGQTAALVDADIDQSTIGPPATVGLKMIRSGRDLEQGSIVAAQAMSFVGAVSPRGHLLPLVSGVARLAARASELGARIVIVDMTGLVGGIAAQALHLAVAELVRPHHLVALCHGEELDPLVGVLQRFLSIQGVRLPVHPQVVARSVQQRVADREAHLAAFLGPHVYRWRVKPTVFLPSLPPGFEPTILEGLLVGIDDGTGDCVGLGVLEHRDDALRLITPLAEGVRALRLGAIRVTLKGHITERVDLRAVFGTD